MPEKRLLRWMCEVTRENIIKNEDTRGNLLADAIIKK